MQCSCVFFFWTQQDLYSGDTNLLTLEFPLNPGKSSDQDLQMGTIKQSRTQLKLLIPVANTSTDDMYVTTSCCLTKCLPNLIAQMAQSNALNCTYSGTKLLNSYWAMLSIPWVYRDTQAASWHQYILFQVSKVGSKRCVLHLMHEKIFSQLRVARKVRMSPLTVTFLKSCLRSIASVRKCSTQQRTPHLLYTCKWRS